MSEVLEKTIQQKAAPIKIEIVQRVTLHGISWETYERILMENKEVSNPHFAYCDGELEIMVLGYEHERLKEDLSELLKEIVRILGIDYQSSASTTFRREEKRKGIEGDNTFYFKKAEQIRGKKQIDLAVDPPPELIIEIDITHGSLSKFPIFADLGIEEVWRFDGENVIFYCLENNEYNEVLKSVCLPNVNSEMVTSLLLAAQKMNRLDWLKLIHGSFEKK